MTARRRALSALATFTVLVGSARARSQDSQAGPDSGVVQFFVSPAGSDAWSGRRAEPDGNDGPFATIVRARDAVRELRRGRSVPVKVVLRAGTHFLETTFRLGPEDSGTEDAPIVYAAAPGERAILSGGRRISGGRPGEVNGRRVWVWDIPEAKSGAWRFRELFVNGEVRRRTRLPRAGMYRIQELPGYDFARQGEAFLDGTKQFVYSGSDIQRWRNLQDVEVIGVTRWITNRLPIAEVDEARKLVTFDRPSLFALDDTAAPRPSVYWVENVPEALEEPGEWYLDRPGGLLEYVAMPGEDPGSAQVVAPRLTQVLRVEGREDAPAKGLWFEGLTFSHAEWDPPAGWASSLQAAVDVPGAVAFENASGCGLRDCTIESSGTYGVEVGIGCDGVEISACRMTGLGAGGVKIGHFFDHEPNERGRLRAAALPRGPRSRRTLVADNEIARCGTLFAGCVGIFVGENPGNRILRNHVHDMPWGGISVGSLQTFEPSQAVGNVVERNHVHDLGQGTLGDIGGIYTNSISPGTRIRFNVVHDVRHRDYGGWGIYTDQGSAEILIEKNLVYRCSSGPLFVSDNRDVQVENNIFALGEEYQVFRAGVARRFAYSFLRNIVYSGGAPILGYWNPLEHTFRFDRNLYWCAQGGAPIFGGKSLKEWRAAGQDRESIVADPLFADPAKGDFTLRPGSPASRIGFEPWDLSDVGPRPRR